MSVLAAHRGQPITLYPEVAGTDGAGNPRRTTIGTTGVTMYGLVQPLNQAEADGSDQRTDTRVRVIIRDFPAGAWSRAVWDGRTWDVLAEPARRNERGATRHATIILQARTGETVGSW